MDQLFAHEEQMRPFEVDEVALVGADVLEVGGLGEAGGERVDALEPFLDDAVERRARPSPAPAGRR